MHIDEEKVAQDLNRISTYRDKNERLSWKRKKDKLEDLVKQLEPIEDKILKIMADEKYPLLDKINLLRAEMVRECVHPKELLVHHGDHVECKFCQAKIAVVNFENE